MDIQRYLNGEAVVAAPPSSAYRFRKFVRRHKGIALSGAAVAAALAAAGVPEHERAGLVEAFERQWGRVNAADTARELIERTILKPAIETIDEEFKEQPAVDAQLRQTLAFLYQQLGLFDAALPLQTDALETNRRVLGEEHPVTLSSINNTGMLLRAQGKLAEAEPYLKEVLDKRRRVLGDEHPDALTSINNMGYLLDDQGRPPARADRTPPLAVRCVFDSRMQCQAVACRRGT